MEGAWAKTSSRAVSQGSMTYQQMVDNIKRKKEAKKEAKKEKSTIIVVIMV